MIAKHGQAKIVRPDQVHFTPLASAEQGTYLADSLVNAYLKKVAK